VVHTFVDHHMGRHSPWGESETAGGDAILAPRDESTYREDVAPGRLVLVDPDVHLYMTFEIFYRLLEADDLA